jgi:hypothetical protein
MTAHSVRKIVLGMKIRPLNSCNLCAFYEPAYTHSWRGLWSIRFLLNLSWCRCWGFSCFRCSIRRIQPGIFLRECADILALIALDSPRIPPTIRRKKPILATEPALALRVFGGAGAKILPESHMRDSCTTTLIPLSNLHKLITTWVTVWCWSKAGYLP